MTKRAYINDIVKHCEARFNRGPAANWKHGYYVDLNREILDDTGVNISANTLKRIFGKISVDDDYIPQQATLKALIQYSGCPAESYPVPEQLPEKRVQLKPFYKYAIAIAVVAVALLVWLMVRSSDLQGDIKLTGTEGTLPETAFFALKLPDTQDSLFVDFGDKSSLVATHRSQTIITHNYLLPGVFTVKLKMRDRSIAQTKVSVVSAKWVGLCFYNQHELIGKNYYELPAGKTGHDSIFNISNHQLFEAGLDTTKRIYTRLSNFSPVKCNSDNFIFEATFKNPQRKNGIYCNSTQFQITGIKSKLRFKFASPGCSTWVLNNVAERTYDGRKENLSQFVCDQDKWNEVKLINKNKRLTLAINGKQIFIGSYNEALGEIKGVFIEFEGNGFVKRCDLKTLEGRAIYHF